jgi:hypothetical protein
MIVPRQILKKEQLTSEAMCNETHKIFLKHKSKIEQPLTNITCPLADGIAL